MRSRRARKFSASFWCELLIPQAGWLFGLSARASLATAPKEQQAKPALDENFLAGLDRARTLTPEIGTRKTLARKTPAAAVSVNFLDAINRQHIASRLALEFVSAVHVGDDGRRVTCESF